MKKTIGSGKTSGLSMTGFVGTTLSGKSGNFEQMFGSDFLADGYEHYFFSSSIYPNKSGGVQVLFTWHDYECVNYKFDEVKCVRRLTTTENPAGKLVLNDDASISDENPFSNSITADGLNITARAKRGEVYSGTAADGVYIIFLIVADVRILSTGDIETIWFYHWANEPTEGILLASAPSFEYDEANNQFKIGKSMTGKRVLEFYNTDNPYGYPSNISSSETLNEMYTTSIVDLGERQNPYEAYFTNLTNTDEYHISKWQSGERSVSIHFLSESKNNNRILNGIMNAISLANEVMAEFGISFAVGDYDRGIADVCFEIDTEYELFGIVPTPGGYVYGGQWKVFEFSSNSRRQAWIGLANDYYEVVPYQPYETVALEELLQVMGAGYDQVEYPYNTIHMEFNYYNKARNTYGELIIPPKDIDILKLLYSDYIKNGMDCVDVALALNIPNGLYPCGDTISNVERTVSASFLKKGSNYKVRVFVVNEQGELSEPSSWISVYFGETEDLNYWYWSTPISSSSIIPFDGAFHPVTAAEWNNFCNRLNTLGEGSFSEVRKGQDFSPEIYNEVATALRTISSPYGIKYAIDNINENTVLCAALFTNLQDQFNYIVDRMS